MYWLLDYAEQENLRQRMVHLQSTIMNRQARDQSEQIFPFIGRKSRAIARTLIENLTDENAVIVDPFGGSGTFAYAALDAGRPMKCLPHHSVEFRPQMSIPMHYASLHNVWNLQ